MDAEERDELLIRLDERVDKIRVDQKEYMRKAESPEGFGRCQIHTADLKEIKSTLTWTRRGLIGGAVALVGKFIYSFIMPTS
ncbi:MAG: hypothetical protein ACYS32_00585 [Planctomycetota bacterium]|jgi:hypothetical protein